MGATVVDIFRIALDRGVESVGRSGRYALSRETRRGVVGREGTDRTGNSVLICIRDLKESPQNSTLLFVFFVGSVVDGENSGEGQSLIGDDIGTSGSHRAALNFEGIDIRWKNCSCRFLMCTSKISFRYLLSMFSVWYSIEWNALRCSTRNVSKAVPYIANPERGEPRGPSL